MRKVGICLTQRLALFTQARHEQADEDAHRNKADRANDGDKEKDENVSIIYGAEVNETQFKRGGGNAKKDDLRQFIFPCHERERDKQDGQLSKRHALRIGQRTIGKARSDQDVDNNGRSGNGKQEQGIKNTAQNFLYPIRVGEDKKEQRHQSIRGIEEIDGLKWISQKVQWIGSKLLIERRQLLTRSPLLQRQVLRNGQVYLRVKHKIHAGHRKQEADPDPGGDAEKAD